MGDWEFTALFAGYVASPLVAHEVREWRSCRATVVVSYGQSYICRAAERAVVAQALDVQPTTSLAIVPDGSALLLAHFTHLHRFAPNGTRDWISERVSHARHPRTGDRRRSLVGCSRAGTRPADDSFPSR